MGIQNQERRKAERERERERERRNREVSEKKERALGWEGKGWNGKKL